VVASAEALHEPEAAGRVVRAAGQFDVLRANLAVMAPSTPAVEVDAAEWKDVLSRLVDPLPRLVAAAAPAMMARRAGKVPCLQPTCAVMLRTALSARSSPFAVAGWGDERPAARNTRFV